MLATLKLLERPRQQRFLSSRGALQNRHVFLAKFQKRNVSTVHCPAPSEKLHLIFSKNINYYLYISNKIPVLKHYSSQYFLSICQVNMWKQVLRNKYSCVLIKMRTLCYTGSQESGTIKKLLCILYKFFVILNRTSYTNSFSKANSGL